MGGFVSAQQAIHLQNSNDSMVSQQNYLPLASENKIEKKHPYIKPFIIPAVFITYGFISIGHNSIHQINISTKNELREDHLHFKTKIDNDISHFSQLLQMCNKAEELDIDYDLKDKLRYLISDIILYGNSQSLLL